MTWLDQVLARPIIGILTRPDLARPQTMKALGNAFLREYEEVNLSGLSDFGATIQIPGGLVVALQPNQIVVQYSHQQTVLKRPGCLPEMETKSPDTYAVLLDQVVALLKKTLEHAAGRGKLDVQRIGIVADTEMDPSAVPPGVDLFLKHLSYPWGSRLPSVNAQLMAELTKREGGLDRCHHRLVIDQDKPEDGVRFTLDWQRLYNPFVPMDAASLLHQVQECVNAAQAYFETVGAGELEYAERG